MIPRTKSLAPDLGVALLVALAAIILLPPGRLPYRPGAEFSDVTLAHWPNAFYLRESVWQHGQWPLWRPTTMLGLPFAANPLGKVWYLPQWLVLIPGPSITLMLDVLVYCHMVFGALGVLAWARVSSLSNWAGVLAAISYALTPKTIAHLGAGHLDLVYAMAWAAWFFWALRRFAADPDPFHAALTGVIAALMALADLRLAAYALGGGMIYAVSLRWSLRSGVIAVLVFVSLLAVYAVPLAALGPSLTRASIIPSEAAEFSLPPTYLVGLLVPDTGGVHEWMTYFALPTIILALLAIRTRSRSVIALWAIVVLSALYALGDNTPLYRVLVQTIPLLMWLRVPSRAWFMVALALTFASAYGAQTLPDGGPGRSGRLAAVALLGAGVPTTAAAIAVRQPALLTPGLASLGTGVALLMSTRNQSIALVSLGAVLLTSLLIVGIALVEARPESVAFRDPSLSEMPSGRIYSPSFSVLPHEAERSGILTLHAVDPFQLRWSAEAINRAAGIQSEGYSITLPHLTSTGDPTIALHHAVPDAKTLAALGVSQVHAGFPLDVPNLELLEQSGAHTIYRVLDARPLTYLVESDGPLDDLPLAEGLADIESLTPNKVVVLTVTPGDSILVHAQAWAPGWRARVDGQRVEVTRIGGVLQGIRVTGGAHRVEFFYRPLADFIGLTISALASFTIIGWAAFRWRKSK